ncbi:hypothetical protein MTO96_017502 [Rhipicephalus appendiculatus]
MFVDIIIYASLVILASAQLKVPGPVPPQVLTTPPGQQVTQAPQVPPQQKVPPQKKVPPVSPKPPAAPTTTSGTSSALVTPCNLSYAEDTTNAFESSEAPRWTTTRIVLR